jgi:N6-adenosine-specific RNA methylase IME4
MIVHPIAGIKVDGRHRKDHGDIKALAASIDEVALLHPIVVRPDRTLVSGERRLKAVELLGWTEVPITVVDHLEDALTVLHAEAAENVCRKDFLPSEAVAMGRTLEAFEREEAKKRQQEHGGTAPGKPKDTSGKLPEVLGGQSRDKVGAQVGLSGRSYEKAKTVVAAAEKEPEKYGELVGQMDRTGKVNGAHKRLQTAIAAEEIAREPPPLPDGRFRVIVVDPPWHYDTRADDATHRASIPYPSMNLDEIRGLDIASRAHDDCVLWLWTTNSHIPHAFEIVEGWGFTYKTMLTWTKDRMGAGDWLRGQTEHCLMAVRGKPTITLTNQTTFLKGPLREHSRKPDEFYALVESLCPGSKLEMFSRHEREGWTCHGNEVSGGGRSCRPGR